MGQNNESDYEYEWKFLPFGTDFEQIPDLDKTVVSRERKLDILVTLDPGLYSCFFKVKDNTLILTSGEVDDQRGMDGTVQRERQASYGHNIQRGR